MTYRRDRVESSERSTANGGSPTGQDGSGSNSDRSTGTSPPEDPVERDDTAFDGPLRVVSVAHTDRWSPPIDDRPPGGRDELHSTQFHLRTDGPSGPTTWPGTGLYVLVAVSAVTLFVLAVAGAEPLDVVPPLEAAIIGVVSFAAVATWNRWGP